MTFDCADPHTQATYWAQVFGSAVEDHSELVDQLVAADRIPADDRIMVNGRSAFRAVAACSDPIGVEPRLFFQRVPEDKIAKTAYTSTSTSMAIERRPRLNGCKARCTTDRDAQRSRSPYVHHA